MSSCNGILALIGGFLIHLSLGQIYTIGNIATYLAAYVRVNTNPDYSYEAASWIYTGGVMFQGLGVPIGGLFDKRFGSRPTAALGCFLMSLGVLTSHWSIRHSSGLLFVTYGILTGLGTGLAYVAPLCCAMKVTVPVHGPLKTQCREMGGGKASEDTVQGGGKAVLSVVPVHGPLKTQCREEGGGKAVLSWFPEHKGLVNGVVLGGYGLSGLLFNFVITVYINPDNLSVDPDTG
ncbi:unnamed protein product [Cyprideis torosa]|uniref:Uncharacterized protein n=1 Tax=Cyprideis torosa TaxID=163714 RepID=A0A7R8WNR8_9CRUS|nr:unnamed protein product [Cyprideis torosa]CAG0906459.1 unnamed protein product [Cyprideis torosa]